MRFRIEDGKVRFVGIPQSGYSVGFSVVGASGSRANEVTRIGVAMIGGAGRRVARRRERDILQQIHVGVVDVTTGAEEKPKASVGLKQRGQRESFLNQHRVNMLEFIEVVTKTEGKQILD